MKTMLCYALLALLAAGMALVLDVQGVTHTFDLKAYDALYYLKAKSGNGAPVAAPLAIIEVDDATYEHEEFKLPFVLWHEHFATIINGLVDAGAKVIGLDVMLPERLFDSIVDGYSQTWLKALVYAKIKRVPLVTGYVEVRGKQYLPHANYMQMVGKENMALFNFTTDQDEFIRTHTLYFTAENGETRDTLPYAISKAYGLFAEKVPTSVYVDYVPPKNGKSAFSEFSFSQVYARLAAGDKAYMREYFKDKIVLIGATNTLSQDRHATPLNYVNSGKLMKLPGVIVHAHIINTLVRGVFTKQTPVWSRALTYVFLALLVGLANIGSVRLVITVFACTLLAYVACAVFAFNNNLLLPLVPGLLAVVLSFLGSFIFRHRVVDREKHKLSSTFKRYLPPEIVQRLMRTKDEDMFQGEYKHLCILFSDIRGFTKYSEQLEPAEIVSRLNEYFEHMSVIVTEHGGIVDKFIGDGMLAFFGALNDGDDNGHNARIASIEGCKAALRMQEKLKELNAQWAEEGLPPFRIGVGMHAGVVMVGNIGSHYKMEYTVIGDAVNLASRLESKTKEENTPILISEHVYKDAKKVVTVDERGQLEIRGHSPIKAYGLLGLIEE